MDRQVVAHFRKVDLERYSPRASIGRILTYRHPDEPAYHEHLAI